MYWKDDPDWERKEALFSHITDAIRCYSPLCNMSLQEIMEFVNRIIEKEKPIG